MKFKVTKQIDWIAEIHKELCDVKHANPGEIITIQVSQLMYDYLYLKLVESNKYMTKRLEEEDEPMVATLFGCSLQIVDNCTTCTFYVHSENPIA